MTLRLRSALPLASALLLAACSQPAHPPTESPPASTAPTQRGAGPAQCTKQFRLLGEVRWDVGQQFGSTLVGGLSGIDWRVQDGSYYLVSDDRSAHDPARIYRAQIAYDTTGLHQVQIDEVHYLRTPAGNAYPNRRNATRGTAVPDPEALRLLPGGHSLVWSSEGDFSRGFGPSLQQATLDGQWQQDWPLPVQLQLPAFSGSNTGPRNNMTLEGIAISDDARHLWLAMEGALKQDGPLPRKGQVGGPVRFTQYDIATRQPLRQIAYVPDALPNDPFTLPLASVNGVSEILADGPDHLLVLERSYVLGQGFGVRLYRIATHGPHTTNTLALDTLTPENHQPAEKALVLDFAQIGLKTVDNIEAMTWGPPLAHGERVLLLVSDNNFNPAEVTQFIALMEERHCAR
ncbi:MAG: esterase-like activity of phytase family protein [Comamonas sp.]